MQEVASQIDHGHRARCEKLHEVIFQVASGRRRVALVIVSRQGNAALAGMQRKAARADVVQFPFVDHSGRAASRSSEQNDIARVGRCGQAFRVDRQAHAENTVQVALQSPCDPLLGVRSARDDGVDRADGSVFGKTAESFAPLSVADQSLALDSVEERAVLGVDLNPVGQVRPELRQPDRPSLWGMRSGVGSRLAAVMPRIVSVTSFASGNG